MAQANTCWMQITAGQGRDECALAVRHIMQCLMKEAEKHCLKTKLLESIPGNQTNTFISVLIEVKGDGIDFFINKWEGTVQWICESPYRPHHKRKNWFIGVNVLSSFEKKITFNEQELKFEAMRASSPGGQHVNKTSSAVRVTHIPTGLVAKAQELRSQHMNKKLALVRLNSIFDEQNNKEIAIKTKEKWEKHNQLERGNPIRVFIGDKFKEKKYGMCRI